MSNWLPYWALLPIKNRKCSKCSAKFTRKDLIAIGIRKNGTSVALYIEHECHECNYRAMTILGKQKEDTLEKMCYALLEGIKQRKIAEKSFEWRKEQIGKMTDSEIDNMISFIQGVETHEEFLKQIGIPPSETKKNDED